MSLVISNSVNNSPLNRSPSKQACLFSKTPRFKPTQSTQIQFSSSLFYPLPSTLSKRAAGIGLGSRSDFTQNLGSKFYIENSPGPTAYEVRRSSSKAGKFTFGVSRDLVQKQYIEGTNKPDPVVPGPGTYEYKPRFAVESPKWTMRNRSTGSIKNETNVGPGSYMPKLDLDPYGKYFVSKYKNSKCCTISPKGGETSFTKAQSPGPNAYKTEVGFNKTGNYFISKYKCNGKSIFGRSQREGIINKNETPGPGHYDYFSEFGNIPSSKRRLGSVN